MKSNFRYVTSFPRVGYEQFKHTVPLMIREHWPKGEVWAYYEEDFESSDNVNRINIFKKTKLKQYLGYLEPFQVCDGVMPTGFYDFKFDISKFCRKAFAILNASHDYEDVLVWLDGDIETYDDIPSEWLESWLADYPMALMLQPESYPDASMMIMDCSRKETRSFLDNYANLLNTGGIFLLNQWHDAFVVEFLISSLKTPVNDIAKGLELLPGESANVFNRIMQGKAKHFKGALKNATR